MLGIAYMLTGRRHATLLAVSLWTLRTRGLWDRPICLLAGDDDGYQTCLKLAADKRLNMQNLGIIKFDGANHRNAGYANKTLLGELTPFDKTIFLDADTAVLSSNLSPLIPCDGEIVLTQFANWTTHGVRVGMRVRKWETYAPGEVARALGGAWPAVNTGVFGVCKYSSFLPAWRAMTMRNASAFIADEIAAQLIFPDHKYRFLSDAWNYSPIYSPRAGNDLQGANIAHFHGKKHTRKPQGRAIWLPLFMEVWRENVGHIQEWAPEYDPELIALIKGEA